MRTIPAALVVLALLAPAGLGARGGAQAGAQAQPAAKPAAGQAAGQAAEQTAPAQKPAGKPAAPQKPPTVPGPVVTTEPGFTIGPEDVLGILVWREPELSGDVTVRPDGMITLPLVRDIRAAGLTPDELAERIQAAVREKCRVGHRRPPDEQPPRSSPAKSPGPARTLTSDDRHAAHAIAGTLNVRRRREDPIMRVENGRTRALPFDYKNVANGRKAAQNILLRPGDTVVVPER